MTKTEFMKNAKEAGYSDKEIQDLVDFHEESGIPYEEMPLLYHDVD